MILLDTSVLIDYFKGKQTQATDKFDSIIDLKIPYGISEYTYQELLQGSRDEHEFNKLKEYLETLPFFYLQNGKKSFEKAALMNLKCRQNGYTIRSTVDFLIAQIAIENDLFLLHNDTDFGYMSKIVIDLKIYLRRA